MSNPQKILNYLVERASRYAINLNGQVYKDADVFLRGGNAMVYPGILQPDGRKVAIKTPRNDYPTDQHTIKRFLKEVHLWSKLCHENVIPVLGITTEFDSTVSIVSPWMGRGNAYDYVQNKHNDPRPLMVDIARGLHYLHTRQGGAVFHGDLKGLNVLISDDGRALLADFDLSLLSGSTFSMTTSGRWGVTVRWTAPEALEEGAEKSAAGDIWSYGMTLLELFTRKKPWHQLTERVAAAQIFRGNLPRRPSNAETCSRLTDRWWAVCLQCWGPDPALRPTIVDVLQATSKIYTDEKPLGATSIPASM